MFARLAARPLLRAASLAGSSSAIRRHAHLPLAGPSACPRRTFSSAEIISLDDIEIETAVETSGFSFEDVTSVDTFARGRVLNFIKRQRAARGEVGGATGDDVFEVEGHDVDGQGVQRCRVRLVLPSPHDAATAEGTADNAKDAEILAAMHAERIIDALGLPIYRLPSMQQKHAAAAREAGRWAPIPDDAM